MKKEYLRMQFTFVRLSEEDIICTSEEAEEGDQLKGLDPYVRDLYD